MFGFKVFGHQVVLSQVKVLMIQTTASFPKMVICQRMGSACLLPTFVTLSSYWAAFFSLDVTVSA